jgi:thiamine biosynthesis protein ThiS
MGDDMRILLNGEVTEAATGCTVAALLQQLDIGRERVAVELNGDIIPKARYDGQTLADDDKIEIVHFVGGG